MSVSESDIVKLRQSIKRLEADVAALKTGTFVSYKERRLTAWVHTTATFNDVNWSLAQSQNWDLPADAPENTSAAIYRYYLQHPSDGVVVTMGPVGLVEPDWPNQIVTIATKTITGLAIVPTRGQKQIAVKRSATGWTNAYVDVVGYLM